MPSCVEDDSGCINMSLRSLDPPAVYFRLTWILGASGSCMNSGLVRHVVDTCGWSRRFWPTPGESTITGMSNSRRWSAGPMPESISVCGVHSAPALSTISFASTMNRLPPDSTSTALARVPSNRMRCTMQSVRSVRFKRWRDSDR